jgi:hypothetical protein
MTIRMTSMSSLELNDDDDESEGGDGIVQHRGGAAELMDAPDSSSCSLKTRKSTFSHKCASKAERNNECTPKPAYEKNILALWMDYSPVAVLAHKQCISLCPSTAQMLNPFSLPVCAV